MIALVLIAALALAWDVYAPVSPRAAVIVGWVEADTEREALKLARIKYRFYRGDGTTEWQVKQLRVRVMGADKP